MKYNVGDKVKIRHDLQVSDEIDVVSSMLKYRYKVATITNYDYYNKYYTLDIDSGCWGWLGECLEDFEDTCNNDNNSLNLVVENIATGDIVNYQYVERIDYDRLADNLTLEYYDTFSDGLVTVTMHLNENIRFFTTKGE